MTDYNLYEKVHTRVNIHTWLCVLFDTIRILGYSVMNNERIWGRLVILQCNYSPGSPRKNANLGDNLYSGQDSSSLLNVSQALPHTNLLAYLVVVTFPPLTRVVFPNCLKITCKNTVHYVRVKLTLQKANLYMHLPFITPM